VRNIDLVEFNEDGRAVKADTIYMDRPTVWERLRALWPW
jgi:hypothetical protein